MRNTFREAFFAGPNNVIRTNTIGWAFLATNASVFARNSGLDQLYITGANNLVARNIVTGGLGIRVVAGAAGNYLRGGNGDPRQCVGVACS